MPQGTSVPKMGAPKAPVVTQPQAPMVQVPDSPQYRDNPKEIQEGLKAMEEAARGVVTKPPVAPVAPPEPTEDKGAKPEPETPTGPAAKGWAAVKKSEARVREERENLETERKAFRHEMSQMKAQFDQQKAQLEGSSRSTKESFQKDPFGTLKREFGVTLNDLATLAINPGSKPAEAPKADNELIQRLDRMEKLMTAQSQQREIETYKSNIAKAIETEQYALLQTMPNVEQEIISVAAMHAQRTGEVLSAEKAAAILLKYWEQHLQTLGSHASARRILGLPDPDAEAGNKPAARPKGPKKTLTNSMSSPTTSHEQRKLPEDLTPEQELREAAKLIPNHAWDSLG